MTSDLELFAQFVRDEERKERDDKAKAATAAPAAVVDADGTHGQTVSRGEASS